MKRAIEHLLQSIEAGATQKSHECLASIVRQGFDAGAFSCSVEHPASEPPDNSREILIQFHDGRRRVGKWHGGFWTLSTTAHRYAVAWWELPAMVEVTK